MMMMSSSRVAGESDAPEAAIDQATAAEATDGVIVVGHRYTASGGGEGRRATQFYTRVN